MTFIYTDSNEIWVDARDVDGHYIDHNEQCNHDHLDIMSHLKNVNLIPVTALDFKLNNKVISLRKFRMLVEPYHYKYLSAWIQSRVKDKPVFYYSGNNLPGMFIADSGEMVHTFYLLWEDN